MSKKLRAIDYALGITDLAGEYIDTAIDALSEHDPAQQYLAKARIAITDASANLDRRREVQ